MIEKDLSRVEESVTKSTYKLGVVFERCEKKSEKSAPKFVPSSNYHKEVEALKPTKTHYPSNPKLSFNPMREVRKETPKPRGEVFVCMYGLKQASQTWYARLKTFLLEHGYVMWSVDKTLFTLKHDNDFLLVQIYVDDIIFGDSSHTLMSSFQKMMENEFQMSTMGELTFFLAIQVKQTKQGTFIHQAKYMKNLMKKFNMDELKPMSTPMSTATSLDPDENGEAVD
jgi:hypothetical protein